MNCPKCHSANFGSVVRLMPDYFVLYRKPHGKGYGIRKPNSSWENPSLKQIEFRLRFGELAKKFKGVPNGSALFREAVKKELKGVNYDYVESEEYLIKVMVPAALKDVLSTSAQKAIMKSRMARSKKRLS